MSQQQLTNTISMIATDAITKYQLVKKDTTDFQVAAYDTAGDPAFGVALNGVAAGQHVEIALEGCVVKAKVGSGGVTSGDPLTGDSSGDVVDSGAAGKFVVGEALQDGDDNDYIMILLRHYQLQASIA